MHARRNLKHFLLPFESHTQLRRFLPRFMGTGSEAAQTGWRCHKRAYIKYTKLCVEMHGNMEVGKRESGKNFLMELVENFKVGNYG